MALGINDLVFFTTLGRANTTTGLPVDATGIGAFQLDYTQASVLQINETGALGGSGMWLDSAFTGTLPTAHPEEPTATTRETGDQVIVGGEYNGMKVAVGLNTVIRYNSANDPDSDEVDDIVGRVYEIKVDTNNDGTFDKVVGFAFEKSWGFSGTPHIEGAAYYGGPADQPAYSLNWDTAKPASVLTDDTPPNIHELALFETLGTATLATFPSDIGNFTLDMTQSTRLTINDTGAAGTGRNDWLEPDAGTPIGSGDPTHPTAAQQSSANQVIVGGPYDGKRVAVGRNHVIREDNSGPDNWLVGRVWEIMVDNNNDGVCETRIGYAFANSWGWANFPIEDGKSYFDGGLNAYTGLDYGLLQDVVCFAAGTMIVTENGLRAVETLTQGDMVQTADNGLQAIRWIGKQTVTAKNLGFQPNLRPIRISAGALGDGLPKTDLVVSPQHRVMLKSHIAQTMFGQSEILVAAKQLLAVPGFAVVEDAQGVEYWHFMMDRHEVVFANGAATESLFTGPEALKSVSRESKAEILALFPELQDIDHTAMLHRAARPIIQGRPVRDLAQKHLERNLPLVARH